MATLEQLTELQNLNECAMESTKESRWKETTQRYIADMLTRNIALQDEVMSGKYAVSPTVDFTLNERGHIRQIEAPVVRDRIVQKSLMKHILLPSLVPYLIYDNYASLKERGTSVARRRFEIMMRRYIHKYGTNGYVLMIDVRKYFENIDHEVLKRLIAPRLKDQPEDIISLIHYIIDHSSHSNKGLNLGSENPQVYAVYYLNPVDQYVKVVKGVKYYGRYMDDIFIIGQSKEELKILLKKIEVQLSKLLLEINHAKTHITKLTHGFTFLQIKYHITKTGRVIKSPSPGKLIRERRRLKALRRKMDDGEMTENDVWQCYQSWRGSVVKDHNACARSLKRMDALYNSLFPSHKEPQKPSRRALVIQTNREAGTDDLRYAI